jgi:hypothetical protein
MAVVRERTILTKQPPLVCKVSANFADRGCHVVSVTDPYYCILGFPEPLDLYSGTLTTRPQRQSKLCLCLTKHYAMKAYGGVHV